MKEKCTMKITINQLKRIIKEEVSRAMRESQDQGPEGMSYRKKRAEDLRDEDEFETCPECGGEFPDYKSCEACGRTGVLPK